MHKQKTGKNHEYNMHLKFIISSSVWGNFYISLFAVVIAVSRLKFRVVLNVTEAEDQNQSSDGAHVFTAPASHLLLGL